MTYTNVRHLRPTNRLIYYAHSEYISAMQDACDSSTSVTRDHTVVWCLLSRVPLRISAKSSYYQKLESLSKISAADSMCLSLLVSTQLLSKVARSEARQTGAKTEFNAKQPFKVIQGHAFWVTEKLTTDCVSLHNNAGLISKVSEEIASENAENYCCRQPHCRLAPSPQATPANIRINLISPESRVSCLHFCRWQYGSIFILFFVMGFKRRVFSAIECVFKVIQGRWFWHQSKGRMRLLISDS